MNLEKIDSVYLLGIGGIGMSALARYFNSLGKYVAGYDRTATSLTNELFAENIHIHFEDNAELIPEKIKKSSKDSVLIIYTPAIPEDMSELNYFKQHEYKLYKRSVVLGEITKNSFTIAVAGTHGKTTTSSMIAHLLKHSGIHCTAFLGGITKNYKTNFISGDGKISGKPVVVVEADEFDRSFLTLHPDISIITSMDADHLDIYNESSNLEDAYRDFARQMNNDGILIHKSSLSIGNINARVKEYSIVEEADYSAKNIKVKNGEYHFDAVTPTVEIKNLTIGLPGIHNVENALATIAVGTELNIPELQIRDALASYSGVLRRFDYQIKNDSLIFIDDYAHHPEEIKACISSIRQLYPDKKITGIFQPHLFTRTRDFSVEFAKSLSALDELILLDIYPARELPIAGVTSDILLKNISIDEKKLCTKDETLQEIAKREVEVLVTLGAGDIDQLIKPIKEILLKKLNTKNE
ncbi:MAG: UDP-N-acetylmuramate--L-alanine ligase [Bacteroidia bacterium]